MASNQIKKRAIRLAAAPALNFFDLANLLCDLHEIDGAALADLPALADMSRRRMYYLLQAGQLIREHQISRTDAETIGWTKLQIIARHLDKSVAPSSSSAVGELLEIAKNHKAKDLSHALRGKRVVTRRVVHFYLSLGGKAQLNEALIKYGAKQVRRRLFGKEAALIRMVRAALHSD